MKKYLFALAAALVGFTSCDLKTDKIEPLSPEAIVYQNFHFANFAFNDLTNRAIELAKTNIKNPSGNDNPQGVVVTPVDENGVMTIEYKQEMNSRSWGKISIKFEGAPFADKSTFAISTKDFIYGGLKVSFENNIEVTGTDAYAMKINNGTITDNMNNKIEYGCSYSRTFSTGKDEKDVKDDYYSYTGTAYGTLPDKNSYSVTIDKSLSLPVKAEHFSDGKITLTPSPLSSVFPFTVEFGKEGSKYANEVYITTSTGVGKFYYI